MLRVSWVARLTSRGRTSNGGDEKDVIERQRLSGEHAWLFPCSQNRIIQTALHLEKISNDDQCPLRFKTLSAVLALAFFTLRGSALGPRYSVGRIPPGTHYSDVPPPDATVKSIRSAPALSTVTAPPAVAPKSIAEQELDFRKRRAEQAGSNAEGQRGKGPCGGKEPLLRTAREADPGHRRRPADQSSKTPRVSRSIWMTHSARPNSSAAGPRTRRAVSSAGDYSSPPPSS